MKREKREALGHALKAAFDVVVSEPVPQCFDALLRKIDKHEPRS